MIRFRATSIYQDDPSIIREPGFTPLKANIKKLMKESEMQKKTKTAKQGKVNININQIHSKN